MCTDMWDLDGNGAPATGRITGRESGNAMRPKGGGASRIPRSLRAKYEENKRRQLRAYELYIHGWTYTNIAASPWPVDGWDNPLVPSNPGRLYGKRQSAQRAVRKAQEDIMRPHYERVAEERERMEAQIGMLMQRFLPRAIAKADNRAAVNEAARAATMVLNLMKRGAKLLGLDKRTRSESNHRDSQPFPTNGSSLKALIEGAAKREQG
ncbi:MAG: hypothetical protein HYR63_26060 [Proteobacteria bacterium]|nr:hypothetical protein [Pseudomonadota bacterium]